MNARFGPFLLEGEERQLLGEGGAVHLAPKAFELLEYLIDKRPRAVAKPQIMARLWPSAFVTEANLASLVRDVRKALGDEPRRPRFLRTVHGFGYAFCGDAVVEAEPHGPAAAAPRREFRVFWRRHEVALGPGENVLGRTHEAAVWVQHDTVSRRHALIRVSGDRAVLEDCGSKNGTYLRGTRVTAPVPLADGDDIRLGLAWLSFRILPPGDSTLSVQRSEH